MTGLEISLSVAGAVIALIVFGLEVHGRALGHRSRRERLLVAAAALLLIVVVTSVVFRLHRSSAAMTRNVAGRLDIATLRQVDVGVSRDFVMQLFGAAKTRMQLTKSVLGFDAALLYERYDSSDYQVQTISDKKDKVVAFVIRGRLDAPYFYKSDPINWILGQTSFAKIGDADKRYLAGDAKFPAYVERHYFGRWGHYNTFWFADRLYSGDLKSYGRDNNSPDSVAVATEPAIGMSDADSEAWDTFIVHIVSLHAERFEGI